MLVCVLVGCNKTQPLIYDFIEEQEILQLATQLNSGNVPDFDTNNGYYSVKDGILYADGKPINSMDPITLCFTLQSLSYKAKEFSCNLSKPQLVCMTKGTRTVDDIYSEVCFTYWV